MVVPCLILFAVKVISYMHTLNDREVVPTQPSTA